MSSVRLNTARLRARLSRFSSDISFEILTLYDDAWVLLGIYIHINKTTGLENYTKIERLATQIATACKYSSFFLR